MKGQNTRTFAHPRIGPHRERRILLSPPTWRQGSTSSHWCRRRYRFGRLLHCATLNPADAARSTGRAVSRSQDASQTNAWRQDGARDGDALRSRAAAGTAARRARVERVKRRRRVRLAVTALAFSAAFLGGSSARAQDINCDRGDLEVMRLEFDGNRAFSDAELAKTIVTTPSAWARRYLHLPFTVKHCLDRSELPNDRARLIIFYRRRGYPKVTVDTAVKELAPGAVAVTFRINEGPPMILRSFVVSGLDSVPERGAILRGLPVRVGGRFDRFAIDAAADTIRQRLHNTGYPRAQSPNSFAVNDTLLNAWDTVYVTPGPRTRIGAISIEVTPLPRKKQQIPTRVVRQIMGLDSGELFREDEIVDAQRAICQTEAYQHVSI